MHEIIKYPRTNNNLISVKYFDNFSDLKFHFLYILRQLSREYQFLLVSAKRINYGEDSIESKINSLQNNLNELYRDKRYSNVVFWNDHFNDELFDFLYCIWLQYEDPLFVFLDNKNDLLKFYKQIIFKILSSTEIVKSSNCILFFKGIEEDVIWIEKSNNVVFEVPEIF